MDVCNYSSKTLWKLQEIDFSPLHCIILHLYVYKNHLIKILHYDIGGIRWIFSLALVLQKTEIQTLTLRFLPGYKNIRAVWGCYRLWETIKMHTFIPLQTLCDRYVLLSPAHALLLYSPRTSRLQMILNTTAYERSNTAPIPKSLRCHITIHSASLALLLRSLNSVASTYTLKKIIIIIKFTVNSCYESPWVKTY